MEIEKETKETLKKQKLEFLKRQYFTLELNKASLESNGLSTEKIVSQMETVQKAYDAVSAIEIGE